MLREQKPGDELDLAALLTYFSSGGDSTAKIAKDNYPRVSLYHLSVSTLKLIDDVTENQVVARELTKAHCAQMRALFDPFSKVYVYSAILPSLHSNCPLELVESNEAHDRLHPHRPSLHH